MADKRPEHDSPVADYMRSQAGIDRFAKYANGGMAGITGLGSAMSFGSMPYMGPWNAVPGAIFGAQSLGYISDAARAAQNEQMHRGGAQMWNQSGMEGYPPNPLTQAGQAGAMEGVVGQHMPQNYQLTPPPDGQGGMSESMRRAMLQQYMQQQMQQPPAAMNTIPDYPSGMRSQGGFQPSE